MRDLAREAALLERLAHPVVVRSLRRRADGRFPHLLLEHLEGPTLDELIARDGALALEQVLPLALHVASALHYLAAEASSTSTSSPSNVVMGAPPRLIDLSVARTLEEAGAVRAPIGTDAYMAPEQRAPDGPPRRRPPTCGASPRRCTPRSPARRGAPREPRRVGPARGARAAASPPHARALADVVRAGLDPDPASRPTARAFAVALEPLVAALPRRLTLGRRS